MMLIAQVTDLHLGFDPDNPSEFNRKRLDQVIRHLASLNPPPALMIASGDLTDRGDADSYRRLAIALAQCPFPVWPIPGNHDDRDNFTRYFPQIPVVDGFVQYRIEAEGLIILFIDTMEPGRHGGAFCEKRARWLSEQLDAAEDARVLIVMHHPPMDNGIEWMTTHDDEPWVARFAACVEGRRNIVGILCGHIHRPITAAWRGQVVTVCASTAPQVALDLAPIDPDKPDGRSMIIADPPAFALHHWNGRQLVTHFDNADEHVMLAHYDEKMQGLVRLLLSERPSA